MYKRQTRDVINERVTGVDMGEIDVLVAVLEFVLWQVKQELACGGKIPSLEIKIV